MAKKKAAKERKIVILKETVEHKGKYEFTRSEKEDIANKLASQNLKLIEVEDAKKAEMSTFAQKINGIKLEITNLSQNLAKGYEYRDFECKQTNNYLTGFKTFKEIKSGRIIDEMALDSYDRQMKLDM